MDQVKADITIPKPYTQKHLLNEDETRLNQAGFCFILEMLNEKAHENASPILVRFRIFL